MKILLVNPPNCGRSIPEEQYGIDSLKQIFRGEPLALEVLAGNLETHEVRIVDLKAEPSTLQGVLSEFMPDIAGITGVTCEANTMLVLASEIKEVCGATVVVGGMHASNDPEFFNQQDIDHIVIGLGKASLRELVSTIESGGDTRAIAGVAKTNPGNRLSYIPRKYSVLDLVDEKSPCYDLVRQYRESYTLSSLNLRVGFVATAFGCPYNCSFCCIAGQAGGRYLTHKITSILRDIRLLEDIPVIRLVDANTFGNPDHARRLCEGIQEAGIKKHFLADIRSDTVVRHSDLLLQWKEAGLRSVIIGFEEISNEGLEKMKKANNVATNSEAIRILHDIGITIVGDFIVSPDYKESQFETLARYIEDNTIDLPILTVLTPLPGTHLYESVKDQIIIHDLDFYTLTNAVVPTQLEEEVFYQNYADLLKACHAKAKL
ncbi:MAG: radical SAM protein [Thermodesulfobacteriota bacterium]|nr:radical SAM protein [Thermodesulfobacteriota bacterium]